ncbi:MAG TPA: hypothetical protein ENI87_13595 [bacterium]|nr:hypothetical protein [bacterium]
MLRADARPPGGAATFTRPQWRLGDRFGLVSGDRAHDEFVVRDVTDDYYELVDSRERLLRRDRDLGYLGQWRVENGDVVGVDVMAPADARYHWPLWVGKRWECEFVERVRDRGAMPIRASYHVEALERITVPAGSFEALRIVRRMRLAAPDTDDLPTRVQIAWYAPAVGFEVRQLIGYSLVELDSFRRP